MHQWIDSWRSGGGAARLRRGSRRPTARRLAPLGRAAALWLLVGALTGVAGAAAAAPGSEANPAHRAVERLRQSRGAEAYARLRELWQTWELVDPVQVEQSLAAVAVDPAVEPAVRVYARTLGAYARRRRGDLRGAVEAIRELGYVTDWLVVGPFENENKTGFDEAFVPEGELAQPVLPDRSFVGKVHPVRWRPAGDAHGYGWLDLGALMRPQAYLCAYATSYLRVRGGSAEPRALSLWVGASGAVKVFWNADLVLQDGGYRQLDADRVAVGVTLQPGFNRLTVKACGGETPPTITVRAAAPDGSPATDIEVSTSQQASTEAAAWLRHQGGGKVTAAVLDGSSPGGDEAQGGAAVWTAPSAAPAQPGPLQRFEQSLARRPDDPHTMAEFARYLMVTGSDAAATHQARDLARRAAEAAPTVDRLLLAGKLAEDRNQRRRWVAAALERARQPRDRVEALLAAARLARSGPHWQDAVPLYDDVLELDPHCVPAILGKVDLYAEAGLRRTALATLRRAARANPMSVALVRAMSGQLRTLGRDTEAAEAEAQYAALRFDDGGYLKHQIDLAVARRDEPGARRWAGRLLDADPASSWAHGVVARALRALGDADGAEATYRRALDLAPDDAATLRALGDLQGERGKRAEQVALLQRLLRAHPQDKAARAYLEHIEPRRVNEDETYAWPSDRFLALRERGDRSHPRRTLRKLTVTTLMPNGLATHFHQVVFQPLTDEAAASSRQFAFPYHADRQVVQIRAAKVYRADGRIDEAIERGSTGVDDPSLRMYTLQRAFYVQFPRLEVGDVVELRYRVEDVAAPDELAGAFGEIEYLQAAEPMTSAEYVVIAPKSQPLRLSTSPLPGLERQQQDKGSQRIYRFVAKNVPAVRSEPHMPPWSEVLAHVHVSSFTDWAALGRWYWGLARDRLDVDDEIRREARRLTQGKANDREKVAAIYHHAATETRYVGIEFGVEGIRPRRAALTLARGWGDCKDKAALIVSMLREVGIDANLVLVRSGLRGRFPSKTASLAPFDHALAYVPSLDLYLDGTAEATGSRELPVPDRGALGLRVQPTGGTLVELPDAPAEASAQQRTVQLELRGGLVLSFRAELRNQGASAPGWRKRYQAESTRRDRVVQDLRSVLGPVELSGGAKGLRVEGLEALEEPVRLAARGTARAREQAGMLEIPLGPAYRLGAEFASSSARKHQLLLGPRRQRIDEWSLRLTAGLKVVTKPKPVKIESPFGSFTLTIEQTDTQVRVRSELRLDRSRVKPADYAAFQRFVRAVDAASDPRITVRRGAR